MPEVEKAVSVLIECQGYSKRVDTNNLIRNIGDTLNWGS